MHFPSPASSFIASPLPNEHFAIQAAKTSNYMGLYHYSVLYCPVRVLIVRNRNVCPSNLESFGSLDEFERPQALLSTAILPDEDELSNVLFDSDGLHYFLQVSLL